jgi:Zn-dependent peptidase ImmA (M78 family)
LRARAAANQLTKALRLALPPEQWFPVRPLDIAREFGVLVEEDDLGPKFEGALLQANRKCAIVINARIREEGRRSFTAGHELGHYSLHRDRPELRCSLDNLLDVAPHPVNIEQEANEFAMTLLMPADDVRERITGQRPSIERVRALTERYGTSLVATALRVREISSDAFCLVYVAGGHVKWCWPTARFQWRPQRGSRWPLQSVPAPGDPMPTFGVFGPEARARVGDELIVSAADMPSYDASLWMLVTNDARRPWEWGQADAT